MISLLVPYFLTYDNGRGEASFQSESGENVYFYPSNRYGNSAAAGGRKFHW